MRHQRRSITVIGLNQCSQLGCCGDTSDHHKLQGEIHRGSFYRISIDLVTRVMHLIYFLSISHAYIFSLQSCASRLSWRSSNNSLKYILGAKWFPYILFCSTHYLNHSNPGHFERLTKDVFEILLPFTTFNFFHFDCSVWKRTICKLIIVLY